MATTVWGPYPNFDDIARFEYGRRMWRLPEMKTRLLSHWLDERHPYRNRFQNQRAMIEEILMSDADEASLNAKLRERGSSLRCVVREIPPVFGSFFLNS